MSGHGFFCPTFIHELVKKRHVGEEKEISKHLSLDLRMDLVALQELLSILEHLHMHTQGRTFKANHLSVTALIDACRLSQAHDNVLYG